MIHVTDFHKAYRETIAVEGLDFAVQSGQVLGLLGPNGAGKTTTLRALAGIIPPTRGTLMIAGHDIVKSPVAAKQEMGFVPDDPNLFDNLTVWEHLQFIASAYRVENFSEPAVKLLEQFELSEKRDTVAQELSRGMRQKVAVSCAYLHDPKVILLDEPLTGLDPRGIRELKNSFVEKAKAGKAILISSHLLALIEDLCSHILILHRGKKLFFGPMEAARVAFDPTGTDASLEEVFFRATEGTTSVSNSKT